ncbi:MAG: substrate-binding domain-containing protein [Solirubrobacterales bacterium]
MLLAAIVITAGLVIAGCGSSGSSSESTTASSSESEAAGGATESGGEEGAGASAGVERAEEMVAKYSEPSGVPNGGPALKNVSSLKGKKIWFVPQSTQIPYFAAVVTGAKEAAKEAGLQIEVCNGDNTPSTMSACIEQAITGGGAGVVGDGITVESVQQAVNALGEHDIPYVQADLTQEAGNDKIAYAWNNSFLQSELAADKIIEDSQGKANILVIRHTDSSATEAFMKEGGLATLEKNCSECEITEVETNAVNLQQLPGLVSAALVKEPEIDYVFPEFDLDVESVMEALQSLGKKLPIYSTTAQLSGLERIKANNYQAADAGSDPAFMGWAAIDQLMRMMLGTEPNAEVPTPVRLFDESNIDEQELTNAAFVDGSWYGAQGFQKMFLGLWGM